MFDPGIFVIVTNTAHEANLQAVRRFVGRYRATAIRSIQRAREEVAQSNDWVGLLITADLPWEATANLVAQAQRYHPQLPVALASAVDGGGPLPAAIEHMSLPMQQENLRKFLLRVVAQEMLECSASVEALVEFAELHRLTVREAEVLCSAVAGIERQAYLSATGVAENTRKRQVQSLLRKCGYSGVERAAIAVLQDGVARASRQRIPESPSPLA